MKMELSDAARQKMFDALLATDGDRAAAARELGVSLRTFYRYLDELQMKPQLEAMGWDRKPGPKAGSTRGLDIVRVQVFEHMRKLDGRRLDYGVLTQEVFGEDNGALRGKIFAALDALRKMGRADLNEETGEWRIVTKTDA